MVAVIVRWFATLVPIEALVSITVVVVVGLLILRSHRGVRVGDVAAAAAAATAVLVDIVESSMSIVVAVGRLPAGILVRKVIISVVVVAIASILSSTTTTAADRVARGGQMVVTIVVGAISIDERIHCVDGLVR